MQSVTCLPDLPGAAGWLSWLEGSRDAVAIACRSDGDGDGAAAVLQFLNTPAQGLTEGAVQCGQRLADLAQQLQLPAADWNAACEQAWSERGPTPSLTLRAARPQRWLHIELSRLGGSHLVAVLRDVTEQVRRDANRARAKARAERLEAIAQVGSWECDIETGALRWSKEMYRVYGRPPGGTVASRQDGLDQVLAEDRAHVEAAFEQTLQHGEPLDIRHRVMGATGTVRHVRLRGALQRGIDGRSLSCRGTAQDITAQVETEARLRVDLQRLAGVLGALPEGLVVHAADGQVVEANPTAQEILGLSRRQLLGLTPMDPRWQAVHEDGSPFPGQEHPASVCLRTGQPVRRQVMVLDIPGRGRRWLSVNASPIMGAMQGVLIGVVASFIDIT